MANIGDKLTLPEEGWQRINDTDSNIDYSNGFMRDSNANTYQRSHHFCTTSCYIKFNFKGTQLRIIGHKYSMYYSDNINIYIDDKLVGNYSEYVNGELYQLLLFSITDLNNTGHSVKLESTVNGMNLDAIDIDSDGYLLTEDEYIIYTNSNFIKTSNNIISDDNYPLDSNLLELRDNYHGLNINDLSNKIQEIKKNFRIIKIKKK